MGVSIDLPSHKRQEHRTWPEAAEMHGVRSLRWTREIARVWLHRVSRISHSPRYRPYLRASCIWLLVDHFWPKIINSNQCELSFNLQQLSFVAIDLGYHIHQANWRDRGHWTPYLPPHPTSVGGPFWRSKDGRTVLIYIFKKKTKEAELFLSVLSVQKEGGSRIWYNLPLYFISNHLNCHHTHRLYFKSIHWTNFILFFGYVYILILLHNLFIDLHQPSVPS